MAHQDSRIQAIAWLQQHAGKEKTVLAIRELMILPTEWKRIASSSTVIPWFEAMEFLQRQRFDYIVTGEFDLRYASDPNAWAAYSGRRDSPSFRCRLILDKLQHLWCLISGARMTSAFSSLEAVCRGEHRLTRGVTVVTATQPP